MANINSATSPLLSIAAIVLFVAVILVALIYFDAHRQTLALLQWIEQQEAVAAVLFVLIMALVVVLLLPGLFFTTGAGFVFGVVAGTFYVVLGTTLGAALAFLLARYCFGRRAADFVLARNRLHLLDREIGSHGFAIVLFTRLIPFFPSKITNYFFGLTSISFSRYLAASLLGFIPFSLHNVYLGAITADMASLGQTHAERTPLQWTVYGFGFLLTVLALIYFSNQARRALASYLDDNKESEERLNDKSGADL